jgi:pilus assembly protein Flp/PilA
MMLKPLASAIAASWRRFVGDEAGATAIEYALIASGISIVIVGTIAVIGTEVKGFYTSVNTALK